jgi:spermidine dehydrogenase
MLGAGAALLHAPSPLAALDALGKMLPEDPWSGPGGTGDYAASNGNTKPVLDAA